MLSGPTIIRISVLLLLAGGLAALVQYLMPSSPPAPARSPVQATQAAPSEPKIRKIAPAPPPQAPMPSPVAQNAVPVLPGPSEPAQTEPASKTPAPLAAAPQPAPTAQPTPAPVQVPSDTLAFPDPPLSAASQGEAEVANAEKTEGPPAIALIDLNTASAAELNRLRGGGNIGRAIIAKRPYAQVSDLLTKRVLSRAVYERIREQVTVR